MKVDRYKKMNNFKNNLIYSTIYQVLQILTPLITTPYLCRCLGGEGIGEYTYSYTIAQYFSLFIMLGLANYGNRSIAFAKQDRDNLRQEFSSIVCLQLLCSVLVLIGYIIYVLYFCQNVLLGTIQLIYIVGIALDISWFYFGMEEFGVIVFRNILVKIANIAGVFLLVKDESDIYIYAFIIAIAQLLSSVIMLPFIKKYTQFMKVGSKDVLRHLRPNLVLFLPVLAISLYKKMDIIMLGTMGGNLEVGYYSNAEKIIQIPASIIMALGMVMLPRISTLLSEDQHDVVKQYFEKSVIVVIFLASAISFGIMGIASEFVPLYFGQGFEKCITLLNIMMPCQLFLGYANILRTQYLIPKQKDKVYVVSVFLGAIINLILNIMLIPNLKSVGAAIGTLCAEVAVCLYQAYIINKEINQKKGIMVSLPFILAGAIMYWALQCLKGKLLIDRGWIDIIIQIIVGGSIYLILCGFYYITVLRKYKGRT